MVPKTKDWVERLNPDSKLPNFNTGRILVPKSQAVNESLESTKILNTPESSKDSEAKSLTPLPPFDKSSRSFTKLRDEKVNSNQKTQESNSKIQKTRILYCMICKREDHRTSDHEMYIASLKRSENYKAQPYQYASSSKEPIWYLDSGCSRSMTGVKSYLHKYVEQPGPKVVFGDNSSCITEGYGSINYGGVVFTKVAFVNGLKYNLISISQLCDAKYIVQFDDKQGTIFNANKEIILIAPRRNDVYVLHMSSLNPNGAYFFAKASETKRKNKTLIKAARTMLNGLVLSKHLWTEAVRVACYAQNKSIIVKRHDKTPYEICRERIPNISYFHVFKCPVFIHNHKDHLGKFDAKANDGYFLGYSFVSKAFRVYNIRRQQIEETYHDDPSRQYQVDSDVSYYIIPHGRSLIEITQENHVLEVIAPNEPEIPHIEDIEGNNTEGSGSITEPLVPDVTQAHISNQASTSSHPAPQDRWSRDQHIELVNIIGNPSEGMLTRSMAAKLTAASASECLFVDFLFEIEPKKVSEALKHPGWIDAMQEELNQFLRNKVWTLVPLLYERIAIGSKWVFKNKKDEHVARMEAIRIFLAFATYMNFKVYQMDVKSAFLNGKLKEEVYVKQPPGFESSEFPDYVCKLDKALYGLKQAPKAWYETLSTFLIQNKFTRGRIDNTLFIYKSKEDVLLVQVYVDDIIFGSTSYKLYKQFKKLMSMKFEMSMIGELTYFLRLQIKKDDKVISTCQEQYCYPK
ncbi:retrovirus-related pol polyprotein from transposon TNT 1-94 [Tanacetum coccineum]|uniref:Retrovirus-related pol polyprotein from transposon TNT 1-94 n=1 Tax=Tanacetum coccineum TaxID=301880 RepID=A0ABQ4ZV88_9ASTR